jgi:hypothetical protein
VVLQAPLRGETFPSVHFFHSIVSSLGVEVRVRDIPFFSFVAFAFFYSRGLKHTCMIGLGWAGCEIFRSRRFTAELGREYTI